MVIGASSAELLGSVAGQLLTCRLLLPRFTTINRSSLLI